MPREIADKEALVNALKSLELTAELFLEQNGKLKNAGDVEVIVHGRDYGNGKRVGPYVRLVEYDSEERLIRQNEWGGNTFYILVQGALDVLVEHPDGTEQKVARLQPGVCFGEMAVLAGVPRGASVTVPKHGKATALEITRPALRLLRKLPKFGHLIDETYRHHGFGRILVDLSSAIGKPLDDEIERKLRATGQFMVRGKHHVLCEEKQPIDKVILIKSGWIRRVRGIPFDATSTGVAVGTGESIGVDYLGAGNVLGLEGVEHAANWGYSAAAMARTEVLEIPITTLADDPTWRDRIVKAFASFSNADDRLPAIEAVPDTRALASAEREIATGLVDAANLLVMDMDLCVRCGNCSLACHKVHGQSRLLRRGISISRPVDIGASQMQHLLSPQVCLHCKDPECLTGCPTGSIFRDRRGHVEIDPHTCIGCFDCATQCPYDAISMMPREVDHKPGFDLFGQLKAGLSLAPPKPPPAFPPADDVVAIKCNLCENTPMNPKGVTRQAYSCEENCPTGALLRVDPLRYFSEIEATQGLIFREQTQAFGRNIHRSDPVARFWRVIGLGLTAVAGLATLWGLVRYGFNGRLFGTWLTMRWLTGIVGLAATAIVMTYPVRKQIYRRRAGALRYWMLAHAYIGALAAVILLMHSGAHTGGLLTTSLYVAFYFVIGTGVFGLLAYIFAPRIMTSIEGEPLLLEDLIGRRQELREEFLAVQSESEGWLREEITEGVKKRFQTFGFLLRQILQRESLTDLLAEGRHEFKEQITRIATADERAKLLKAVEIAITLRRVEALIYLHRLLQLWIPPHVISTSLMLALMIVHIIQVIYFAVR